MEPNPMNTNWCLISPKKLSRIKMKWLLYKALSSSNPVNLKKTSSIIDKKENFT